jgi:hypothetical protein
MFNIHFAVDPPVLTPERVNAASANQWTAEKKVLEGFGRVVQMSIGDAAGDSASTEQKAKTRVSSRDKRRD